MNNVNINNYYPFENLPLPYGYNALEPFIDEKTMQLHHDRHLQTYIDNLNAILEENPRLRMLSLKQLIMYSSRLPRRLRNSVRNNAGGVYNHRFFFDGLINPAPAAPSGNLETAIIRRYGSFDNFKEAFKNAALSVFGSGYAWLVVDRGMLRIVTTANQNSPIEQCLCPVLTIDVWEHAYYLKHFNLRADYIDDFMRIINWDRAEKLYTECVCGRRI